MTDVLWLAIAVTVGALLIVPTFYGVWRAWRTEEWGWAAWIILGWVFGLGWIIGLWFLLGPDLRQRRMQAS